MKNLNDYLTLKDINRAEFARLIKRNPSIVTRILNKTGLPSLELAVIIERVTGGWMKVEDWVDENILAEFPIQYPDADRDAE